MWGSTSHFAISNASGAQQTGQLCRVQYKRPETWAFMCWARIDQIDGAAATDVKLNVIFNFYVGVGRSTLDLLGAPTGGNTGPFGVPSGLVNFQFPIGALPGATCWTTSAEAQGQVEADFSTPIKSLIDKFPAMGIQVSATVAAVIVSSYTVKLTAGVQLAPVNHIRPDWFKGIFDGEELAGS
jgi:hypothetical protein